MIRWVTALRACWPDVCGTRSMMTGAPAVPGYPGPRDVIRADGRYGLATGLICGLIISLAAWYSISGYRSINRLWIALAGGLTVALGFGLSWIAAGVWARYHIAVVITAICRSGPLRFGASLDWAYQAGLLRLSGTAYQFRHRQLQDRALTGGDSTEKKASQTWLAERRTERRSHPAGEGMDDHRN